MEKAIFKVEHIWCAKDDRWVYIEKDELKIIGMNFMQGDEYKNFKEYWCVNNPPLFKFYREMLYTFPIEEKSVTTMEFINKCMWAYHSAVSLNDKYN
jgi:hypothetical protein